jgi:hypothetical protein
VNGKLDAPAALPSGKNLLNIRLEGGGAELVWMSWRRENSFALVGIQTPDDPAHSVVAIRTKLSRLRLTEENFEKTLRTVFRLRIELSTSG